MIFFPFLFCGGRIYSQDIKLTGVVLEKETSNKLALVSVLDKVMQRGVITDQNGNFNISLSPGQHIIEFSFLGYERREIHLNILSDTSITVFMQTLVVPVDEVTISAGIKKDNVSSAMMSTITLTNKEMMKLPALLGEADALKFLQLTPGVKSGSYGGVGFYVRGGGVDQNLILYDGTIVYNPGHLLGMFSVFNPEIIRDVTIIKSGIPARYGGKLSSVIELNSYKGNRDSIGLMGSIGLISSRASVSLPLLKGKGTIIAGFRRTYLELLVNPIVRKSAGTTSFLTKDNNYNFYDFNAGGTLRINERDRLAFSLYFGRDKYNMNQEGVRQESNLDWGNYLATLNWSRQFNRKTYWNTGISWTKYNFSLDGTQADYKFGLFSSVEDYSLKSEMNFNFVKNLITTGLEITEHAFVPNRINAQAGNFNLRFGEFTPMNALEAGIFIDDEYQVSKRISLAAGLRISFFEHHGPFETYLRNSLGQIIDTVNYPAGKALATFMHPEPRLVLKYQLDKSSSVKMSYMRLAQYIHLATSASATLPTDIWIPSSSSLEPLIGEQYSCGFYKNFMDNSLEFSTEVYFKKMQNQLAFLRGIVNISIDGNIQDNMAVGYGQSYGMEFYLGKTTGNTTGWLSYTLSRTENRFDKINNGYFYPAKYDARHDISLTLMRKINQKWSGSVVFVYLTGNAFTMPVGRYIIQGNVINQYGNVNSFRLPPNHRMDVSLSYKIKKGKKLDSELVLSVYNLYNRANPFFIYYEVVGDIEKYTLEVKAFEVTLIPMIPSLSWNFRF